MTLHLYRRARSIAGAIARGLSLHRSKRSRLHFVRGSRGEAALGSPRMQRIISRLADALIVMDSRLVIRVENMVTTSSLDLEVSEVDLNGTRSMSKYLQLSLLVLLVLIYFLHFPSSEYFNTIKRLCR